MLLKNPQLLWGLLVLAIPVLIHLLRLRRFRKTPFTNVRLLQQLVVESNRSSQLKKWLLLLARLGLLSALVLAFTQPFMARPDAGKARRVAIYLDNSFSMQAPQGNSSLLQGAVQTLLQQLPPDFECALLTPAEEYTTRPLSEFREILLNLPFSHQKADAAALLLRADALLAKDPQTIREIWLISDFQELDFKEADSLGLPEVHALPLRPDQRYNMSLDTAFISARNPEILELQVIISLDDTTRVKPLSLFNRDTLIAKSAPELTGSGRGQAVFSLPAGTPIEGAIRILDEGLTYDNN
ncbi:MAG TPA: BatA domain-containing protein, partial [Robiginitalea sp.]|nr:BatA domain-containing protein [Robiginitalea sp.]